MELKKSNLQVQSSFRNPYFGSSSKLTTTNNFENISSVNNNSKFQNENKYNRQKILQQKQILKSKEEIEYEQKSHEEIENNMINWLINWIQSFQQLVPDHIQYENQQNCEDENKLQSKQDQNQDINNFFNLNYNYLDQSQKLKYKKNQQQQKNNLKNQSPQKLFLIFQCLDKQREQQNFSRLIELCNALNINYIFVDQQIFTQEINEGAQTKRGIIQQQIQTLQNQNSQTLNQQQQKTDQKAFDFLKLRSFLDNIVFEQEIINKIQNFGQIENANIQQDYKIGVISVKNQLSFQFKEAKNNSQNQIEHPIIIAPSIVKLEKLNFSNHKKKSSSLIKKQIQVEKSEFEKNEKKNSSFSSSQQSLSEVQSINQNSQSQSSSNSSSSSSSSLPISEQSIQVSFNNLDSNQRNLNSSKQFKIQINNLNQAKRKSTILLMNSSKKFSAQKSERSQSKRQSTFLGDELISLKNSSGLVNRPRRKTSQVNLTSSQSEKKQQDIQINIGTVSMSESKKPGNTQIKLNLQKEENQQEIKLNKEDTQNQQNNDNNNNLKPQKLLNIDSNIQSNRSLLSPIVNDMNLSQKQSNVMKNSLSVMNQSSSFVKRPSFLDLARQNRVIMEVSSQFKKTLDFQKEDESKKFIAYLEKQFFELKDSDNNQILHTFSHKKTKFKLNFHNFQEKSNFNMYRNSKSFCHSNTFILIYDVSDISSYQYICSWFQAHQNFVKQKIKNLKAQDIEKDIVNEQQNQAKHELQLYLEEYFDISLSQNRNSNIIEPIEFMLNQFQAQIKQNIISEAFIRTNKGISYGRKVQKDIGRKLSSRTYSDIKSLSPDNIGSPFNQQIKYKYTQQNYDENSVKNIDQSLDENINNSMSKLRSIQKLNYDSDQNHQSLMMNKNKQNIQQQNHIFTKKKRYIQIKKPAGQKQIEQFKKNIQFNNKISIQNSENGQKQNYSHINFNQNNDSLILKINNMSSQQYDPSEINFRNEFDSCKKNDVNNVDNIKYSEFSQADKQNEKFNLKTENSLNINKEESYHDFIKKNHMIQNLMRNKVLRKTGGFNSLIINKDYGKILALGYKKENFRVEIRKKITSSQLNDKRFKIMQDGQLKVNQMNNRQDQNQNYYTEYLTLNENFVKIFKEEEVQLDKIMNMNGEGVDLLNKLLENLKDQTSIPPLPIKEIFETQIPVKLLQILRNWTSLKAEKKDVILAVDLILWIISNLFATKKEIYSFLLYQHDFIKILDQLIQQGVEGRTIHNSICIILGNIAGESNQQRQLILTQFNKLIDKYIYMISRNTDVQGIIDLLWSLKQIFRQPFPGDQYFSQFKLILPYFQQILRNGANSEYENAIKEVLQLVTCFCESQDFINIQESIQSKIHIDILNLLEQNNIQVQLLSLKTLGCFAYGTDSQCKELISIGFLEVLEKILKNSLNPNMKLETCWILSNFSAGENQIKEIMIQKNIFQRVVNLLQTEKPIIQQEAMYVLCNATENATLQIIEHILQFNLLEYFKQFIQIDTEVEFLIEILEGLDNILTIVQTGEGFRYEFLIKQIEQIGLNNVIEQLCDHQNDYVSKLCRQIIDINFKN
ncbi:Armadillo-type fold [Pseudocohnilembus persalinus]|uniref:Armadillo-type fold n=1 Tax=Pseudocohnilembus persalinus TaxID=266149 RepID=A0A0V0QV69_PSEPJ|nr:Armadillo-type fold [Pseudocohnilembus persalinus]|eukprot:KRX06265.1 Armadillo-type fold [Pseudocohnilembus persalinus]